MKILIPAPTYLPSRRANTIQVMKMAQAIRNLGHEVLVLVPNPAQENQTCWDDLAHHYGLNQKFNLQWIPLHKSLRSYDYGFKSILNFRRFRADILYTRLPQAAAFASLVNIPTIFELHDLPGGSLGPLLFRIFLAGKGAIRLVFISKSLRDEISRRKFPIPGKLFTIVEPDGVDLARYENLLETGEARFELKNHKLPEIPVDRFTVGYTGHMYPGRGIELIFNIAAACPDMTFLLIGGDPHAIARYQNKVTFLGLDNIFFTGFIPNAELPGYQAACDVLLMPYQHHVEASSGGNIADYLSPMKLFEYLACGRVILSSDLPVLREILNEHNAILLQPDDIDAWVDALKSIQSDPGQHASLSSQARIDSFKYSWNNRAERIFSVEG